MLMSPFAAPIAIKSSVIHAGIDKKFGWEGVILRFSTKLSAAVYHQAARVGEFSERINCWNFLLSNEGNYLLAPNHKERIRADQQRAATMVRQRCYSGFQLV